MMILDDFQGSNCKLKKASVKVGYRRGTGFTGQDRDRGRFKCESKNDRLQE